MNVVVQTLRTRATCLFLAFAATAFATFPASAAETLRFGHDQQESHAYHFAGTEMARLLAEKTGGAYEIKVFPGAQLGNEPAMLDGLRSGNIDFAIAASGNAATALPFLGMFSVSYLFENSDHLKRALNDPELVALVDRKIADADVGFRKVAWFTAGARNVYNNQRPIMSVADVGDIKLRVMSSPVEAKVWGMLGAKPLAIPFGEVYTGMQTGLVQAAENTPAVYAANKHHEVAPHFSLTAHQWMVAFVFVSDATWNKLPEDLQKAVLDIGQDIAADVVDYVKASDEKMLNEISEKYDVKVNEVDKSGFISTLAPVQDEVAAELGMEAALARIRAVR